jgi:peptidylprolyl isomerase
MRTISLALACAALLCVCVAAAPAGPQKPAQKNSTAPKSTKSTSGKWITTKSGLKYMDVKVGTGATPKLGQTVKVNYVGTFPNGKEFDNSKKHGGPIEFQLGRVIQGWNEGLSTMKVGGTRKLICPPNLAYGPGGTPDGTIPPNATLYFTVELLGVR